MHVLQIPTDWYRPSIWFILGVVIMMWVIGTRSQRVFQRISERGIENRWLRQGIDRFGRALIFGLGSMTAVVFGSVALSSSGQIPGLPELYNGVLILSTGITTAVAITRRSLEIHNQFQEVITPNQEDVGD